MTNRRRMKAHATNPSVMYSQVDGSGTGTADLLQSWPVLPSAEKAVVEVPFASVTDVMPPPVDRIAEVGERVDCGVCPGQS